MKGVRQRFTSIASSESGVLAIICLGVFSTALDQTVVVAALPGVMVDLEIPLTDLDRASWIVTAYLVAYTVAMPLGGRLSDVHGRIRMFQAALVLFSIGSLFVALAPNFEWIVSARVIQAIGGGATVPIGLAMAVAAVVAAEKRGCHRTGGRRGRGRIGVGSPLRRSHHRVARLAVDILAGHTPELHSHRDHGHLAEPSQSRRQDGLLRGARARGVPHLPNRRAVPARHLLGRVL